jgi:pilus assembly protein CpaF
MQNLILRAISADGNINMAHPCAGDVLVIGRDDSCEITVPHQTVSRRHAEIRRSDGGWLLRNLSRSSGILVGRNPVQEVPITPGLTFALGEVVFTLDFVDAEKGEPPASVSVAEEEAVADDPRNAATIRIRSQIHNELVRRMNLLEVNPLDLNDAQLRAQSRRAASEIIYEFRNKGIIPIEMSAEQLLKDVLDETHGLGPLQDLMDDPDVEEIMVNGPYSIYVSKKGHRGHMKTDRCFIDDEKLVTVINRILAPIHRSISQAVPLVDGRIPATGSRINATVPPVSLDGPTLTIRKFPARPPRPTEYTALGSCTEAMMKFFKLAIECRQNCVVAGGTGAGKTTLLNVLSSFIPSDERIITIEDSAELQLQQPHVVRLETRPASREEGGVEEISIRRLVKNSLRMTPDRIIVGECRGEEAVDMLQAMNTGHDGSMTTGHANGTADMLSRLETMVLMAGLDLPLAAIREQVVRAVNLIIFIKRFEDGKRRIAQVSEVIGLDEGQYVVEDVYRYNYHFTAENKLVGSFIPTGRIPSFVEEAIRRGIPVPHEIFEMKSES